MLLGNNKIKNKSGLWNKLWFLFFAFVLYRVGSHIPVPGLDSSKLNSLFSDNGGGIFSLFNLFSGGSLSRLSIFALGVMPYISASIIIQLLSYLWGPLIKIKKDGAYGRKKISQYTRLFTVILAIVQAFSMSSFIIDTSFSENIIYYIIVVVTLVTGTVFLMWLGEQITEKGVGNGISLLIFISIVSNIPSSIMETLDRVKQGELHILIFILFIIIFILLIFFIVFMERAQRKIVVNYAKRQHGRKIYAAQKSYLPLKINMAGVIPPIFASSIILFPVTIIQWYNSRNESSFLHEIISLLSPGNILYMILYGSGVLFFCFFYTALVFNPKDTSNNLKKSGGFISGIRPGDQTTNYIDSIVTKLTFIGSIYILIVSLSPEILVYFTGINFYFGGTSLLIMVVVIMDFVSNIQTQMISYQYESLMKKSKLRGII